MIVSVTMHQCFVHVYAIYFYTFFFVFAFFSVSIMYVYYVFCYGRRATYNGLMPSLALAACHCNR